MTLFVGVGQVCPAALAFLCPLLQGGAIWGIGQNFRPHVCCPIRASGFALHVLVRTQVGRSGRSRTHIPGPRATVLLVTGPEHSSHSPIVAPPLWLPTSFTVSELEQLLLPAKCSTRGAHWRTRRSVSFVAHNLAGRNSTSRNHTASFPDTTHCPTYWTATAMASMFEQPRNGTLFLGGQKISGSDIRDQNGMPP